MDRRRYSGPSVSVGGVLGIQDDQRRTVGQSGIRRRGVSGRSSVLSISTTARL